MTSVEQGKSKTDYEVDTAEVIVVRKMIHSKVPKEKSAISSTDDLYTVLHIADSLLAANTISKADLYILLYDHLHDTRTLLYDGHYDRYLASAYYGLHLLSKHDMKYEVPRLFAAYQYQVISYYVHNFVPDDTDNLWSQVMQVIPLLLQYEHYDMIEQIRLNLLQNIDRTTVSDSLAKFNLPSPSNNTQQVGNSLKKGLIFEGNGQQDSARIYYGYLVDRATELQCTRELYLAYIYTMDTYITEQRWDRVSAMIAELPPLAACDSGVREEALFQLYYREHELSLHQTDYRGALSNLVHRRDLAARVHQGQAAQHLSDLYVDNAVNQLRVYHSMLQKEGSLLDIDWQHIAQLMSDSKARATQRMRNTSSQHSGQQRLLDSLWHMTQQHPFEHPVYTHLYAVYQQEKMISETTLLPLLESYEPISGCLVDVLAYDDETFILTISSEGNTLRSIQTDKLNNVVREVQQKLYLKQDIVTSLAHLDQTIFGTQPLLDDTVTVVPDGALYTVPLYMLPSLQSRQCYLRYNSRDIVQDSTLTLTSTEFSILSYTDGLTLSSAEPTSLPELGEAYKEVKAISKMLPEAKTALGLAMTKVQLEAALTADAIHVATHAFVDSTDSYAVGLYVREAEQATPYYGYQLPAAGLPTFVYLNACETADGHYDIGEGNRSLSRYFLQGGTQTVVKTLWQVDDRSSAVFSTTFYKAWLSGLTVYDAMITARDQAQQQYSHPYYWAGYVLEGNPNLLLTTQ